MMQQHVNHLGQTVGFPVPEWRPPMAPPHEVLEGRACRLEPLDVARHAKSLFAANAMDRDGRMWTYLPYGPFATIEQYQAWIEGASGGRDPLFCAIVEKESARAIGVSAYLRIDPRNGVIEVGHLAYSPLLQRTVMATEAMYLMMRKVFELGYRRYEWKCDALNVPSRAAAERLGFMFEGIFRQAVVVKGRNRDTAWYSIIDRDWPRVRGALERWLDPANFESEGKQRVRLSQLMTDVLGGTGPGSR